MLKESKSGKSSRALISGALVALWLATLLPQSDRLTTSTWEQLSQRGSGHTDIVGIFAFATLVLQTPGFLVTDWLCHGRGSLGLLSFLLTNAAVYLPAAFGFTRRFQEALLSKNMRFFRLASWAVITLLLLVSIASAIRFWMGGGNLGDSDGRGYVGLSIASLLIGVAATYACLAVTKG